MYYLSKFCRICVQTGVKLLDLDTLDFDEVKLSEKLEVCTKMVITRESLSTDICVQCIAKLRISYQFQDMCKKSTKTLQSYLEALLNKSDEKVVSNTFINTELSVIVTPVKDKLNQTDSNKNIDTDSIQNHKEKRKRITKEQRCSLLKRLLTPEKYKKERDKFSYEQNVFSSNFRGGLRNIIHFTKNYEFGVKLDKNSNYETTPLDKLKAFSNEFFSKDFSEFRDTILYIIENKDNLYEIGDSDEDVNFQEDTKENVVKFEEVVVEPDIKIKTEMEYDDEEFMYNVECAPTDIEYKREIGTSTEHQCSSVPALLSSGYSGYTRTFEDLTSSSTSLHFLDNFVGGYHVGQRRTFSQNNVRCRTRHNPYINPMLKEQFLYRSFKCEKCNRYFKSPGYLKAHYSKVH